MKQKRITTVLTVFLLFMGILLSGCSIHNETLDGQMQQLITAINQNDTDAIRKLLPTEDMDEEEFKAGMEHLYSIWNTIDPAEAKLIQLNVTKSNQKTVIHGVYSVPETESYNCVLLVYEEAKGEEGHLTGLQLGWADTNGAAARTPLGIFSTILAVVSFAFIVFTIVDIARKRPIKYGWYIVLALFTFFLNINGVSLTAPLGAIIYWCIRRSLLEKKANKMALETAQDVQTDAFQEICSELKTEDETNQDSDES